MRTAKASASARVRTRAKAGSSGKVKAPAKIQSEAVAEYVANWKPKKNSPVYPHWEQIAPVVAGYMAKVPIDSPKLARKYMTALSRHAAARHGLGHVITDPLEFFSDASLVTTYGKDVVVDRKPLTQQSDLLFIRRLRAVLLPELYGSPKELRYAKAHVPDPYSETEINQMLTFARGRSSKNCRPRQGALLLSLGAGLSGVELRVARGSDLIASPWGLFIETEGLLQGGNRGKRVVPILATYEDELSSLAKEIGDGLFLGTTSTGGGKSPSNLTARSDRGPRPHAYRARSTWLRDAIASGASLLALRYAGVPLATEKHLWVCSNGLEIDFAEYVTSMRGSKESFDQSKHQHLRQYALGQ